MYEKLGNNGQYCVPTSCYRLNYHLAPPEYEHGNPFYPMENPCALASLLFELDWPPRTLHCNLCENLAVSVSTLLSLYWLMCLHLLSSLHKGDTSIVYFEQLMNHSWSQNDGLLYLFTAYIPYILLHFYLRSIRQLHINDRIKWILPRLVPVFKQ